MRRGTKEKMSLQTMHADSSGLSLTGTGARRGWDRGTWSQKASL